MLNCPKCNADDAWRYKARQLFRCKSCDHQFSIKSGTIFNNSKLPLEKIARLLELVKEGKNALTVSKVIPIQYKTAWNLVRMVNKTPQHIVDEIHRLAKDGYSTRAIEFHTGVSKGTVAKYTLDIPDYDVVSNSAVNKCNLRKKKYLNCGYCEEAFMDANGEKSSDLKRGRIKRAFCCHRCAMNYRSRQRHNDKCKRCHKSRKELSVWFVPDSKYQATGVCFTKGYCPRCYGLLQQFHFNDELATTHELTQTLKKEINNDDSKKHRRPPQHASGGNRRGAQGESRSSSSAGDFGSFFSHLAVSPS